MTDPISLQLGRLEGKVEAYERRLDKLEQDIQRELTDINGKVDQLIAVFNQGKGGWKVILIVSGLVSAAWAVGLAVVKFFREGSGP